MSKSDALTWKVGQARTARIAKVAARYAMTTATKSHAMYAVGRAMKWVRYPMSPTDGVHCKKKREAARGDRAASQGIGDVLRLLFITDLMAGLQTGIPTYPLES